jgi:hypothetical protein
MTRVPYRLEHRLSAHTVALVHALILSIGLAALATIMLRHFIGAPNFGAPIPVKQGFESGVLAADERADRITYVMWLASPLLVLALTGGLNRLQRQPRVARTLQLLVKPMVLGATFLIAIYSTVSTDIAVLGPRQKIFVAIAGILAIAIIASLTRVRSVALLARITKGVQRRHRVVFLLLLFVCGWIIFGLLLRLVVQSGSAFDTYHAPFAWSDLQAPATGAFPLTSYIAQYSHIAGYFVEPYIRIIGGSALSMSALMMILGGGIAMFVFIALRKLGSVVFAAVGTTCVMAFGLLPNTAPGGYFQVFPLRYFGPFLLVALFALLLNRRDRSAAILGGIAAALIALNNPEWGGLIACAYLMFRLILVSTPQLKLKNLRAEISSFLLGAVAITAAIGIYIRLRSGFFPNFVLIFDFGRVLSSTNLMIPDESLGLGLVMYATFLASVASAFGGRFRSTTGSPTVLITSLVGVCGLLLMIYTSGRSLPVVDYAMFFWWGFAVVLLVGELISLWKFRSDQVTSFPGAVLTSPLFVLAMIVVSAVTITPSPINQIDRILNGPLPTRGYIEDAVAGIDQLTKKEEVVLFSLHDGRTLAAMSGRQDYFPFNSSVATGVHRGQVTAIVQAALGAKASAVVVWAPCCTPGPTLDAFRVMGFQNADFHDTGWKGGRAGPLVLRSRKGPSGLRSSENNRVRVSATQAVLQTVAPSEAATTYWLESIGRPKVKLYYESLTVINTVSSLPNGDVVLAGARYIFSNKSDDALAVWTGFVERRTLAGKIIWTTNAVAGGRNSLFDISITETGELLATGLQGIDSTVGAESPLELKIMADDGSLIKS